MKTIRYYFKRKALISQLNQLSDRALRDIGIEGKCAIKSFLKQVEGK